MLAASRHSQTHKQTTLQVSNRPHLMLCIAVLCIAMRPNNRTENKYRVGQKSKLLYCDISMASLTLNIL